MQFGPWLAFIPILFSCIALGLHYAGFQGPMVLDAGGILVGRAHIFAHGSLSEILSIFPSRPMAMLSFYANYLVTGLEPYYFRWFNAVLLGATSFALFLLIKIMLALPHSRIEASVREGEVVAFIAAVAFLAHPLQAFVVLYEIQRMALLACFFCICSLLIYLATRIGLVQHPLAGYVGAVVLFLCAVLSKENSVSLLPMIVIAEIAFFDRRSKTLLWPALGVSAALVGMLMVGPRFVADSDHNLESGILQAMGLQHGIGGLTLEELAFSQARMQFSYLSAILFPFFAHVPIVKPVVISTSITDPLTTLPAVAGVLALLAGGVLMLRTRPLTGFGSLWFVITAVPEAFSAPQNLFFAHRAVLPMVGVLLVIIDFALMALNWAKVRGWGRSVGWGMTGVAVVWVVFTAAVTVSRAELWRDPIRLWADSLQSFPDDVSRTERFARVLVLNNLGEAYLAGGKGGEAIGLHQKALEVGPDYPPTLLCLGKAYSTVGKLDEAQQAFERALQIAPNYPVAHEWLGLTLVRKEHLDPGLGHLQAALDFDPYNPAYHYNLGWTLNRAGKPDQAVRHFRRAVEILPDYAEAHFNLALVLQGLGRSQEAREHMRNALSLDPTLPARQRKK
jgi:protein O-mannosyl-transferase